MDAAEIGCRATKLVALSRSNELPFESAAEYVCELLSRYGTARTVDGLSDAESVAFDRPRLEAVEYAAYLIDAIDTAEARRAMRVFAEALDMLGPYETMMGAKVGV